MADKVFLVVRDSNRFTTEIIEFGDDIDAAWAKEREMRRAGHKGELVISTGKDLKTLLYVFSEYDRWAPYAKRPKESREKPSKAGC